MLLSEQYHELSFYTLAHPDKERFIHQYIIDAQTAQTANADTRRISIVFSLIGLYLAVEKRYPGRQVQQVHVQLSKNKYALPEIILPQTRGIITIADVLAAAQGAERDEMIGTWCASVWDAYKESRETVINYLDKKMKL